MSGQTPEEIQDYEGDPGVPITNCDGVAHVRHQREWGTGSGTGGGLSLQDGATWRDPEQNGPFRMIAQRHPVG